MKTKTIGMLCMGTVGDILPFIEIGKALLREGHRVRLSSHEAFRQIILRAGLEFYPIAGDPKTIGSMIANHKSKQIYLPTIQTIKMATITIPKILISSYDAMIKIDPVSKRSFKPNVLIANPEMYGHIHIAEKLNIPLILVSYMPQKKTNAFPHPLSGFRMNRRYNKMSYTLMQILHNVSLKIIGINTFRKKIGLKSISNTMYNKVLDRIPKIYLCSKYLIPEPMDWTGGNQNIIGSVVIPLQQDKHNPYNPPDDLKKFLEHDQKPIFVGFGSMAMKFKEKMQRIIVDAAVRSKQRVVLQNGWAGYTIQSPLPDCVIIVNKIPHRWLFERVAAVVHHGGHGTTMAGLYAGKPTCIIPFFGDQYFWAQVITKHKVGITIPSTSLSTKNLAKAFQDLTSSKKMQQSAQTMGRMMSTENSISSFIEIFNSKYSQ